MGMPSVGFGDDTSAGLCTPESTAGLAHHALSFCHTAAAVGSTNKCLTLWDTIRAGGGGCRRLAHTRWVGGRGYLTRGECIGGERFLSRRGECVRMKAYERHSMPSLIRLLSLLLKGLTITLRCTLFRL